jgi:hypothetical protein
MDGRTVGGLGGHRAFAWMLRLNGLCPSVHLSSVRLSIRPPFRLSHRPGIF